MANNRLLFYCKECLGFTSIAKYYPVEWAAIHNAEGALDDFFAEHKECLETSGQELGFEADIWGITTEMTWEGEYVDYPCRQLLPDMPDWWGTNDHEHISRQ